MTRSAASRRILLIKPSSLGDIVHALPVLAALRDAFPRAHIAWLAASQFAPLLDGHPLLDEVLRFDRRAYGRMLTSGHVRAEFARFVRRLRAERFDLVVDLQGLFRSGFLAWASGAPRRFGFAGAREFAWMFYSHRVRPPRRATHAVAKNLELVQALLNQPAGVPNGSATPVRPPCFPLGLRPDELGSARAMLNAAAGRRVERFIAVLPGARWESKRWPAARFAELLDCLHADGRPACVLLGAPDERPIAAEITRTCRTPPIDLVGHTPLRTLAALLAEAELVITNDSGPMHLAAALDRPTVAVFGPTSAARTGPYSRKARVLALRLPCAPCYRRQCPLQHHRCLRDLDARTMLAAVRELLPPTAST